MGRGFRHDNRGVSLVEIVIVVAIIAVLGAVGVMGFNAMTGRPAQQCAQKIVYSLEKHRTSAMSKVNTKYELSAENNKIYLYEYATNDPAGYGTPTKTEIGTAGVKLSYVRSDDPSVVYELVNDSPTNGKLALQFDRGSGSFKRLEGTGVFCTKIIASRGGRDFEVTLVPLTGKVYID